ncbi:hypothetical protein SCA6_006531 [Theobroma cacao]
MTCFPCVRGCFRDALSKLAGGHSQFSGFDYLILLTLWSGIHIAKYFPLGLLRNRGRLPSKWGHMLHF